MAELELHITCSGCGRIRVMRPDQVTPFDQHRLRCSHCGARNPKVEEVKRIQPFQPGYVHGNVTPLHRS